MSLSSKKIQLLPEHLIDQIKAGEVIERPGSLIKETLENSIDAGSTKIDIKIINNGLDLISIKDNGAGIEFEDLPLAFSRHATSKINEFEDLYKLDSFGFRGEALASIASISKVQCISSTHEIPFSGEIHLEGGLITYHGKKQKILPGTEIVIQNLFYNTPVRMKFIQSQTSEKKYLKKIIYSFIFSNPQINFTVQFDNEEKEIFHSKKDVYERLTSVNSKMSNLIQHLKKEYDGLHFDFYLIPKHFKCPHSLDYFFINNRFILDKQYYRVIEQSILNTFHENDFRFIGLLQIPKSGIDVNVHPNKTSVKCFENSKILSLISSTIKEMAGMNKPTAKMIPTNEMSLPNQISFHKKEEFTFPLTSNSEIKQNYNLDGIFSPHQLNSTFTKDLIWIGEYFFILKDLFGDTVFNAKSLIKNYLLEKLKNQATSTPLLVSLPYKKSTSNFHFLDLLKNSGAEIEDLDDDTVVIREIPEWMSSMPVKNIFDSFFLKNLDNIDFNVSDWPSNSWEKMINFFGVQSLIKSKVALNLSDLLRENLK